MGMCLGIEGLPMRHRRTARQRPTISSVLVLHQCRYVAHHAHKQPALSRIASQSISAKLAHLDRHRDETARGVRQREVIRRGASGMRYDPTRRGAMRLWGWVAQLSSPIANVAPLSGPMRCRVCRHKLPTPITAGSLHSQSSVRLRHWPQPSPCTSPSLN